MRNPLKGALLAAALLWLCPMVSARLVAVMVGCSYENDTRHHLPCPPNDVQLVRSTLLLDDNSLVVLTPTKGGEPITKAKILAALRKGLELTSKGDTFLFFFSGHGDSSGEGETFLVPEGTPNVDFKLREDTISAYDVREMIAESKATTGIVILDACNSGGKGGRLVNAEAMFGKDRKQIYTLAAARIGEKAYEITKPQYSVFTYALVSGLLDQAAGDRQSVDFPRLQRHVQDKVSALCVQEGKPIQTPVFMLGSERVDGEVVIRPIASIPSETKNVVTKPIGQLSELANIKPGIGVLFTCSRGEEFALPVASKVRKGLLDLNNPVYGHARSAELNSVIERASSLEGSSLIKKLPFVFLIKGTITYEASTVTVGTQQTYRVTLNIQASLLTLDGETLYECSTNDEGGLVVGAGSTESSAFNRAQETAVKRLVGTMLPKISQYKINQVTK